MNASMAVITEARHWAERQLNQSNPSWVKDPCKKLVEAANALECLTPAVPVNLPESEGHLETVRRPEA